MAKNTIPTKEDVDKAMAAVDHAKLKALPQAAQICAAYQMIRPLLAFLSAFWIIPATWQTGIKTFMSVLDTVCP